MTSHILVRCVCGGHLLVPSTRAWRVARWLGAHQDSLPWGVLAFIVVWFMVGSGAVSHAR